MLQVVLMNTINPFTAAAPPSQARASYTPRPPVQNRLLSNSTTPTSQPNSSRVDATGEESNPRLVPTAQHLNQPILANINIEVTETSSTEALLKSNAMQALGEWFETTSGEHPNWIADSSIGAAALTGSKTQLNIALQQHVDRHDPGLSGRIALYAAAVANQQTLLHHIKTSCNFTLSPFQLEFYETAGIIAGHNHERLREHLDSATNLKRSVSLQAVPHEEMRPVNAGILAMSFAARIGNLDAIKRLFAQPYASVAVFGPGCVEVAQRHEHLSIVVDLLKNPALYQHGAIPANVPRDQILELIRNNQIPFDVSTVLHQETQTADVRGALAFRHNQALESVSTLLHAPAIQKLSEDQQLSIVRANFVHTLFPLISPAERPDRVLALVQHLNQRINGLSINN